MRSSRWFRVAPLLGAIIALILLAGAGSGASAGRPPQQQSQRPLPTASVEQVPNTIVVRFGDGVPPGQARGIIRDFGGTIQKEHGRSKLWVVKLPEAADQQAILASLHASGLVDLAAPDVVVSVFDAPNDPGYPDQWHLHDISGGINAEGAWELAPSAGAGVVVAVIDTGVAFETYTGPAILWSPQQFAPAPDLAGVPIVAPWNFLSNSAHANDDHGHGTHVSGTILQATGNGHGVAGVAHGASLMPIKILDYSGNGSASDLIEAIHYAVDNGARVINMSLGFGGTGQPDAYGEVCTEIAGLKDALDYAFAQGVSVVAAAGNAGQTVVSCPAAYHTVVAVGATRFDGQATFYSNSGFALDIAAPGGDPQVDQDANGQPDGVLQETLCLDAFTLLITGDYTQFCPVYMPGTSMASPHVAGVAALLLGENPALTPLQVRHYLETTAQDRGAAGWDDVYGWGALDARAALAALQSGPPPVLTPTPPPPPPGNGGPSAPTSLTATALSASAINLEWVDNASNETGYKVERRVGEAAFLQVALLPANATTYSSTGLTAATTYDFRVRAAGSPDSYYSNLASAATFPPPAAPASLTATALSMTSIRLDWIDSSPDETGFRIERSKDGGSWLFVTNLAANSTTYTNVSLTAGSTYAYRVRAFSGTLAGPWSTVATATTFPPPAAPSDLTAAALSATSVQLDWTDNTSTETGFRVERSSNDGASWQFAANVGADVTTWTNKYLTPATSYLYRVRTTEGTVSSGWSNVAAATTLPPPPAPSGLTATGISNTSILLTWTDESVGETGFKIERSIDGSTFLQIATVAANTTSYVSGSLTPGTAYWYRLRAYEGAATGPYSEVAQGATLPPPPPPTGVTATALSNSSIRVNWTDNATTETAYRVERSVDGVTWMYAAALGANATTWTNTSLLPGATYHYRVRASEGSVHGAWSEVATATTLPPPAVPTGLSATALSATSIRLAWTDNSSDEQGFKVERSLNGGASWSYVAAVSAGVTTWTNNYLAAGTTYHYRVRAYQGSAHSEYSNVVDATTWPPPAAPSDLTATMVTATTAELTWVDNSLDESGFRIERSSNGGASWQFLTNVSAGVTSRNVTSLVAGTTYQFRVRAYAGTVVSTWSNVASVTP